MEMDLKKEIFNKGFRQTWVAEQIGKTAQELNKWLNGARVMPTDIKDKIENLISAKS